MILKCTLKENDTVVEKYILQGIIQFMGHEKLSRKH